MVVSIHRITQRLMLGWITNSDTKYSIFSCLTGSESLTTTTALQNHSSCTLKDW